MGKMEKLPPSASPQVSQPVTGAAKSKVRARNPPDDDAIQWLRDRVTLQTRDGQRVDSGYGHIIEAANLSVVRLDRPSPQLDLIQRSSVAQAPHGDVAHENEADWLAGDMMRTAPRGMWPLVDSPPKLQRPWQAAFERALGRDLSPLRIRDDAATDAQASAIDARAFTRGADIAIAREARSAGPDALGHTLAHEVVHAAQQGALPPHTDGTPRPLRAAAHGSLQRAPTGTTHDPVSVPTGQLLEIPAKWLHTPGPGGLAIFAHGDRLVILPAPFAFSFVEQPKPGTDAAPAARVISMPTLGKNAMVAVNVGGRIGFLLDVGGDPAVVWPGAITAVQRALGMDRFVDIRVTHGHDDHFQSIAVVIRHQRIPPGNVHFPEEFWSRADFRKLLTDLGQVRELAEIGYGANAVFGKIPTQATGAFYRVVERAGDVELLHVGLSAPIRDAFGGGGGSRTTKNEQTDAGSLVTRVTHVPSGRSWLYLSDMHGKTLTSLRGELGEAAYNELVGGVTTIIGLQHHLGASDKEEDLKGIIDLLQRTQLRSGNLRVVVQSTETYGGRQFLNRSFARAAQELGIEVVIIHEPVSPSQVGTATLDSAGGLDIAGENVEVLRATPEGLALFARLTRLREVEKTLSKYEEFVQPQFRQSQVARAAREHVEGLLRGYIDTTIHNIRKGATGRAQSTLEDPTAQAAALRRVQETDAFESTLTSAYLANVKELARLGPHLVTLRTELAKAQKDGQLSEKGFDALWEVDPASARKLVESSGLSRGARRDIAKYSPGAGPPATTRAMAGFLLAAEVFELVAPMIEQHSSDSFDAHVRPFLDIILWWQAKGVSPKIQGVNDRWWPRSNEWTDETSRISELLQSNDLDWLALNSIPDEAWRPFMLWASANLIDASDFQAHIWNSTAVTWEVGTGWKYKAGEIHGKTWGHELEERWVASQELTRILDAAYTRTRRNTEKRLAEKIGQVDAPNGSRAVPRGNVDAVLSHLPRPTGRFRFRIGEKTGTMYSISNGGYPNRAAIDVEGNLLVYAFPAASVEQYNGDVPAGYVVVAGADFHSYSVIRSSPNRTKTKVGTFTSGDPIWAPRHTQDNPYEVLLAKESDLVPAQ